MVCRRLSSTVAQLGEDMAELDLDDVGALMHARLGPRLAATHLKAATLQPVMPLVRTRASWAPRVTSPAHQLLAAEWTASYATGSPPSM
jgi:hypothetical protein